MITETDKDAIIARLEARIAEYEIQVAELKALVTKLTEQINKNSSNSSKPPSTDPPWKPPDQKKKKRKKRKRGAQKGHKRHTRPLVPESEVSSLLDVKPEHCQKCGLALSGEDPEPLRHQVVDIPEIKPVVDEYRLHKLQCQSCGCETRAKLPKGVTRGAFGPKITALIGTMTTQLKVSKRDAKRFISDVFHVDMALGSISKQEQRLSEAIAPPVAEAAAWVQHQAVANLDETGWYERNQRFWLWVMATALVVVYKIAQHRSRAVLMSLLGENWSGIVVSDRFTAYNHLQLRQLCWAHLTRDFVAMAERPGESRNIGRKLLALSHWVFRHWYRYRRGLIDWDSLGKNIGPLANDFLEILFLGADCDNDRTAGTCREIIKVAEFAFTFVQYKGVEPTNNHAERAVRPGTRMRKTSFGTQSENGSRFVERALSCDTSLHLQGRSTFGFFGEAMLAKNDLAIMPSLIPHWA